MERANQEVVRHLQNILFDQGIRADWQEIDEVQRITTSISQGELPQRHVLVNGRFAQRIYTGNSIGHSTRPVNVSMNAWQNNNESLCKRTENSKVRKTRNTSVHAYKKRLFNSTYVHSHL